MAVAFVLGGIVMLLVERATEGPPPADNAGRVANGSHTHSVDATTPRQALGVGLCQVLALIPGVSRSGATIVGGMLVGFDRPSAAEFSFFLAMPTMAAAFAHSLLELRHQITADRTIELVIGFVMAFVASVVVVRPFLAVVRRRGFAPFAWYRIVAGILLLAAVAFGML